MSFTTTTSLYCKKHSNDNQIDNILYKRQLKARQEQHHRHQSKVSLISPATETQPTIREFCVDDTNNDTLERKYKSKDSNEAAANLLQYEFCVKSTAKMSLFTTTIISSLLICEQRQKLGSTQVSSQTKLIKMQKKIASKAPSICCTNNCIKYNQRSTYTAKYSCPILLIYNTTFISSSILLQKRFLQLFIILLLSLSRMMTFSNALLVVEPTLIDVSSDGVGIVNENSENVIYNNTRNNIAKTGVGGAGDGGTVITSTGSSGGSGLGISTIAAVLGGGVSSSGGSSLPVGSAGTANGYLDKLNNLERSVAAVLIKVAYGTTSTTKRSIPDNSYVPSLTTMATPLLTTLRYLEKSPHQQINLHHRNYELDLERDHALPTSAPNADILKSNSNPTYPNPNRHHNHDRERHHHLLNSTPLPSLPNILKKNKGQLPTISMYPGDIPSYSPPARSFFTPPLPPEYQNPFADKPTLRGTNNEGIIANTGTYINRRPIPPPSLMPGHERIPFRPPDLAASTVGNTNSQQVLAGGNNAVPIHPGISSSSNSESERKKALNTPSRTNVSAPLQNIENKYYYDSNGNVSQQETILHSSPQYNTRQEVLPSIRRILSGSNGNKGEIPEVLLKQATSRPIVNYHQPPSSPVVIIDNTLQQNEGEYTGLVSPNINRNINGEKTEYESGGILDIINGVNGGNLSKTKTKMSTISTDYTHDQSERNIGINGSGGSSTPSAAAAISETGASPISETGAAAAAPATSTSSTINASDTNNSDFSSSSPSSSSTAATHATWTIAWNIHVYLSVILFTILAVYSLYKMLTYNKLTHLFSQSYFVCIHLILIIICASRIFYLCYDAYNIHSSFHIFVSELLLNLPATFLTISFSVLILFLFLKSLNHKNNRYSALIRPLTVVVGCGVHVVLCITLHYVESYTMQNQQYYYQQQQLYRRQHQNYQMPHIYTPSNSLESAMSDSSVHLIASTGSVANAPPPRVLSLICQIIYIFICLSLGLLYLYLYRILKRILRSKSQNYIHGYQNLSYAIHITIATALLFVLLAALQIFGAISISTTRPLIAQVTVEIDWLQWGYQFSLRLIEIAIITLLSWVAGLKTSAGSGTVGISNGDSHLVVGVGGGSGVFNSGSGAGGREKHGHHHNHSNVAGFFFPCTSSSSQEQFDTDYPAVCNANTNLHTYTMRTGKLIYNDSLALNSLASGGAQSSQIESGVRGRNNEFQQLTYQRPYDTGSLRSSAHHNAADYYAQGALGNRYNHDLHQYADYLTDTTTDHYENPNFDVHGSCVENSAIQKFAKTSTTSTTVSSSGGSGSSAASQQQKLLLQSDSCYSQPLQSNCNSSSNYEFNHFERSKLNISSATNNNQLALECWSVPSAQPISRIADKRDTKSHTTLERSSYENPERRSCNSTYSCASSSGGAGRYTSYNSFERGHYSGVRKSGTLNNIVGGSNSIMHIRNSSSSSATSSNVSTAAQRASGVQTLALSDRYHAQQQYHSHRSSNRVITRGSAIAGGGGGSIVVHDHGTVFGLSLLERENSPIIQQEQQQNSDDDMMLSDSNVERTNLINNEDGSCITNSNRTASGANVNEHSNIDGNQILNHHQHENMTPVPDLGTSMNSNSGASSASESATSGSMLVAEHGFVRFRALDDINNAQGVGIHNASIRNQNRSNISSATNTLNAAIVSS